MVKAVCARHCFVLPNAVGDLQRGERYAASPHHIHNSANCTLATSTPTTSLPHTSTVVKYMTSKFRMISVASGRSISTNASKLSMKTSIYRSSPSPTLSPSSTCQRMARHAKSNTPSITPVVWAERMARLSSRSGHISILPRCPHERWDPAHDTPHWTTVGVVGTGKKSSDWVSTKLISSGARSDRLQVPCLR